MSESSQSGALKGRWVVAGIIGIGLSALAILYLFSLWFHSARGGQ